MRNMIAVALLTCTMIVPVQASSQEWGKVEPEVLAKDSHPLDPDADAVVLFDIGERNISVGIIRKKSGGYYEFDITYTRHRRVKILTESGKERADVRIPYWHKDKFRKLEAQTILTSGKKIKLDDKQIFEESAGPTKEKVFAFPGVEVGSVIEYRYEIGSEYLFYFSPWYFQNEEPTVLSEFTVQLPPGFKYRYFFQGPQRLEPAAEEEELRAFGLDSEWLTRLTWKMEDIEGIPKEPDMGNIRNHQLALFFLISSYKTSSPRETWDDYAEMLSEEFRYVVTVDKGLKDRVVGMVTQAQDDVGKARILYDYVRDEIEATSPRNIFDLKEPHKIVEDRKGSRIEKNILLVNLLRHAGFEAYPVLIVTKDRGRLYEDWPQINQFNHVLAFLKIGEESYFLDASSKYCPFGLVSPEDLAGAGLAIYDEGGEVVTIPQPGCENLAVINTEGAINEEGDIRLSTKLQYTGYRGIGVRERLGKEKEEKEYIEDMLNDRFSNVVIDSFAVSGIDDVNEPLEMRVHYRLPGYAQAAGDMIYLSVPAMIVWESNPYHKDERIYPIEYDYPIAFDERIDLSIPEGYRVVETPASTYENIQGLKFTASCAGEGRSVHYQRSYTRDSIVILPSQYPGLRDFFANVVSSEGGQLVLGR